MGVDGVWRAESRRRQRPRLCHLYVDGGTQPFGRRRRSPARSRRRSADTRRTGP